MSKKSEPRNQNYFVDSCLDDPLFRDWLVRDKLNTRARCNVCHKMIELSSSGRSALNDHAKGQKHKTSLDRVQNFFKPRGTAEVRDASPKIVESNPKEQSTLDTHLERSSATKAEIIWSLNLS